MKKPIFMNLWNNFPLHSQFPTLKDLYTWLGGQAERNIFAGGFTANGNTCASRMSVALNKSDFQIDPTITKKLGLETLKTKEGHHLLFRVRELKKYILYTLGTPSILDITSPFDDLFALKSGIVIFDINWVNSTGHIALFNGLEYREPKHDNYSRYIMNSNANIKTKKTQFWELS
ncbi:T6SS effector amidase Tae4 family protein [Taylorella equigenitalis]|uniref:T6SS effector amidase Tae4 family protein n=1 Tax=Taylorella equigenitalis TaxID=29575 RepID=UPI00237C9A21|nr:T6SS effector amidase Tae4 family protein [Taylorella equigenitalis]WDU54946.1 type VI secretion system amidase effector protein Tae4 [Taylorella equigenitalis]